MIDIILLLAGISIVMLIAADFLYTVFIPRGAGMVTGIMNKAVSYIFAWFTGNNGKSRLLEYKWLVIILFMLLTWTGMIWTGITLIYQYDYGYVIHSQDKSPASIFEKIYFAGYTLSTPGTGDFVPSGYYWQILTATVSFADFILVTIGVTYLVPAAMPSQSYC